MARIDDFRIAVIVPTYNEGANIENLAINLKTLIGNAEIIIVDGGSADDTLKLAKKYFKVILSPRKGRGAQMNYAAQLCESDILFFLHADSILEKDALTKIKAAIQSGKRAGCFSLRFDSSKINMKLAAFMSRLRVKLRNIAFGDQGIFIEKTLFFELGGFRDIALMEDYQLSMDLKERGIRIVQLRSKIITSGKMFYKNGWLKTVVNMQRLQSMYRRGEDINKISSLYK